MTERETDGGNRGFCPRGKVLGRKLLERSEHCPFVQSLIVRQSRPSATLTCFAPRLKVDV